MQIREREMEKPNHKAAWGVSIGAALDLIVLVLIASSNSSHFNLLAVGACEIGLILEAARQWQIYFTKLIKYEIWASQQPAKDAFG
jgi:hypothetical protein